LDETGCSVLKLLGTEESLISDSRYASYRELVQEAKKIEEQARRTSQKKKYGKKKLDQKGDQALEIVRLKGKNREGSRRTRRQEAERLAEEAEILTEDSPE
jgi:chromatin segregation and condensation protein Rec8/ScpA/Scc1 (kleisin family)